MKNLELKDLKELTLNQLKDKVAKRPDIFINILLIAVTLFVTIYLYSYYRGKKYTLEGKIQDLKARVAMREEYQKTESEYKEFIKAFPEPIQSDRLITTLSDFAVAHNVQILTFSPAERKSEEFFDQINININIASDNYDNIVAFLKQIESSAYSMFIQKWSGKIKEKTDKRRRSSSGAVSLDQKQNPIIEANIEISSITLKK